MTRILSVSVSDDEFNCMQEMKLSPSKLLQVKIQEMWENCDNNPETYKQYQMKIKRLGEELSKRIEFLEKKGLNEEFLKENNLS